MSDMVRDVFGEAVELPAELRGTFLDAACGDDDRLRREVDHLLRAHDRAGDFLSHPIALVAAALETDAAGDEFAAGQSIGGYTLIERLGRGGSSNVWRARQQRPVERDVALKVLRADLHAGRAADRFVTECQALARMQHPAIAKVFDAGATGDGVLWLAMELIDGEPIVGHCEVNALPMAARLELFAEVCLAVQHAHTKGIVHRDLKPSNVLVTQRDGRARPVVIDFGISGLPGDGGDLATAGVFGTPEYMSPEQAELGSHAIDARTDVYSLGVVLYELACGARPHLRQDAADTVELLCSIREHRPPPPSHRTARPVPREVDWIVGRAMAKCPAERYPTPVALADDVQRLLRHEVVMAGPGTAGHRIAKFVRRHRLGVGAAIAVVLSLAAGTAAALSGWLAAEREAANAKREASKANRAFALLDDIWAGVDAPRIGRPDFLMRDLLAEFERVLPSRTRGEPAVELRVRCSLARLRIYLGSCVVAEEHAMRALDLAEQLALPEEKCVALLLRARARFERGELAAAELDAIAAQRLIGSGTVRADAHLATALEMQANCRLRDSDREGAMRLAERALALRLEAGDSTETARSYMQMANLIGGVGRTGPAMELVNKALACLAPLGEDHPDTLVALQHRAFLLQRQGDLPAAEETLRDCLARRRRVYGDDHPQATWAEADFAWVLHTRGEHVEAEQLLRHALPRLREHLGERHLYATEAMQRLGMVLAEQHQFAEAETLLADAARRYRTLPGHPVEGLAGCLGNLARLHWLRGDRQQARADQTEALAIAQDSLPPDHFVVTVNLTNLASMAAESGDREEAVGLLRDALRRSQEAGRAGEAELQRTRLVRLLLELGRHDEAEAVPRGR